VVLGQPHYHLIEGVVLERCWRYSNPNRILRGPHPTIPATARWTLQTATARSLPVSRLFLDCYFPFSRSQARTQDKSATLSQSPAVRLSPLPSPVRPLPLHSSLMAHLVLPRQQQTWVAEAWSPSHQAAPLCWLLISGVESSCRQRPASPYTFT